MRLEIVDKVEAPKKVPEEIRSNKKSSSITNPRSETIEIQNSQHNGSQNVQSIGDHSSDDEYSDTEDEGNPLRGSKKGVRHPAKSVL